MKYLIPLLSLAVLATTACAADKLWIDYPGKDGPGKGKRVVLIAGDEEYRSEEALPQLARILSERHGFTCTALFSINPATGEIDPTVNNNEPGTEALGTADLVIISLRFRAWPDAQMKHFADYISAGKPVIALRTSTHAFSGLKGTFENFNWDKRGGFGKQVLGETWVSHWGNHKKEGALGVVEAGAQSDPILRGVENVFGDTDVYEAYPPADAKILMRGQVTKGMTADSGPADYKKKRATDKVEQSVNDPMMPVVWTRVNDNEFGKGNKVLCTTLGSSTDLQNEGLRRLIVNAAYAYTGLEVPAKADVALVGEFKPLMFGFGGYKKGVKPSDLAPK